MESYLKDLVRLRESHNFLGFEFLSWLFLLLDHESAQQHITSITKNLVFKTEVQVILGNKLVSCLFNHREQKTSVTTPLLEHSHEVFASLKNGHVIESLALSIALAEISIGLTLNATDFALTQVKISANYENDEDSLSEEDKNQEEVFLRLAAIEDAEKVINGLFEYWLALRMNAAAHARELERMRGQINERLGRYIKSSAGAESLYQRELGSKPEVTEA